MSKFNNFKNYNPDILETIANLSNDEVFTPPKLANEILDLLPKEIWSDSTITFLDPAVKTGIFLREIASRLIDGLAEEIPDLQERVNHILTKQVFGIGITELTTLMARRTVYCSMTANGEFSIVTEFDNEEGNIIFPNTEHTWNDKGRCEFCGANKDGYGSGADRENYAYPFIHANFEKEFENMKFDVIIGNPPYQMSTGDGNNHQALPLYNEFVEKAIDLQPKYISMIIPSRWMKGGMGLNDFRKQMMNDTRIKEIHDFQSSYSCFENVRVDGGICYFVWDKEHNGDLNYYYEAEDGYKDFSIRKLKNKYYDKIIRDSRQLSIISKVTSKTKSYFTEIVATGGSFGFNTFLFNQPERYPGVKFSNEPKNDYYLIHGVEGKGGSRRVSKYINKDSIKKNEKSIDKYKLFYSKAYDAFETVPPKIIKGPPGTLSTDTFIKLGNFDSEREMLNCLSYIKTKFFRALLLYNRHSIHISKSSFELIPLQKFNKKWTDEELYKKYKLTQEEIDYIEETIAPMPTLDD